MCKSFLKEQGNYSSKPDIPGQLKDKHSHKNIKDLYNLAATPPPGQNKPNIVFSKGN